MQKHRSIQMTHGLFFLPSALPPDVFQPVGAGGILVPPDFLTGQLTPISAMGDRLCPPMADRFSVISEI